MMLKIRNLAKLIVNLEQLPYQSMTDVMRSMQLIAGEIISTIDHREPCEFCRGPIKTVQVWEEVEYEFDDRETVGWGWKEIKPNHCPNCGRDLGGGQ